MWNRFELEDPPSTSSTINSPPPSPPASTQQTSTAPTSTPSQSSPSGSSTPSSSPLSTASSLTSTSSPASSSDSNTASSPVSSSSSTPLSFLPQPTVIQGNAGSLDSKGSRDKGNTGLIAGLSVAGCVLAGILAGLVWYIRRKRRAGASEQDDGEERKAADDPAERSEVARPYALAEKARLPRANGGGGGVIGLGGAFTRVLGKRNVTMDISPTSTDGQGPSPGVVTMNEKQGLHDTPLDSTPSSSAAQSPQSAASNHGSDNLSPGSSISPSNDQPPHGVATHSPITTRRHPPSMGDSPPTYTAADPTSALWAQRIQMVAALPALVQQTQPPSLPVASNRDSVARVQMDPELD
ncbi:hypothetical protein BJ165DRAFT_1518697 [Panaeolus papilionaceus]|nr:hypothetical protein BJ165DRAFT_1518697 [Panaeolus papilionaceus]